MASLTLDGVTKSYGKTRALTELSLSVGDGEFFVILGPSGAGKTTTLKSVAGLEPIDDGSVHIGGTDMAGVEPYRRNVAMAFESYALYPQKTVHDNLASPLRSGRTGTYSRAEQDERIREVTETLGIAHLRSRFPRELSNGQRQRVALGRVLVRPAGAYLLDEPLSHLDAKLRAAMRAELKQLGAMSSTTTLYVTHDYQEALALGDRIAVLRAGQVVQVGTAAQIWSRPSDTFVARALGQPEMMLLPATVDGGRIRTADGALDMAAPAGLERGPVLLGIRPRALTVGDRDGAVTVRGSVRLAERLGRVIELTVRSHDTDLVAVVASAVAPAEGADVTLCVPPAEVHVFVDDTRWGSVAGKEDRDA
ncbi:sugar ABC transporter ATP-binding protein [Actinocatenispora thailandica]|uniref:Sugar ABC transporter ATP-binding protein n=1 Tax=Actinocatenispora thailandica TaxID=227318 RepID=A0A7R7HVG9_9ACTN|nr:ABC transporter ATP-binding protein [Actinocatenispora thailandica]BCJ33753.1 sugar ABC transporter ATP-binding protein [Actinocatenispora thailandica]